MNDHVSQDYEVTDEPSEWFWRVLESAEGSSSRLAEVLGGMEREEIIRFHREFKYAAERLADEPFSEYLRGRSEDGIADLTDWIVSQGREAYAGVLADPASMPADLEPDGEDLLSGVTDQVFYKRFGENITFYED